MSSTARRLRILPTVAARTAPGRYLYRRSSRKRLVVSFGAGLFARSRMDGGDSVEVETYRAVCFCGIVQVGDLHEANHRQFYVFQIEGITFRLLRVGRINVIFVGIGQHGMMPGAT